jgi:serine/threonine protein kinase
LILSASFDTDNKEWKDVSEEGKAFIKKLLQQDPKNRPSAQEAIQLPWIQSNTESSTSSKKIDSSNLKEYVKNLRTN